VTRVSFSPVESGFFWVISGYRREEEMRSALFWAVS